ncbi:MAG: QueT transporter family protein [Chloroflexi bacterium]|nr:QueT transporter family protein [Chloroflexota bacterium]
MPVKELPTRKIVMIATIAALYAVLTVAISPISYGPIQLRISEVLKVFVLFDPWMVVGIGIGTFFANLFSPFAGPWELIWMPITDMAGGLLVWGIYHFVLRKRWPVLPMSLYALTTGLSVGLMLTVFELGEFWFLALGVVISELIVLIGGVPLVLWIKQQLLARGIELESSR